MNYEKELEKKVLSLKEQVEEVGRNRKRDVKLILEYRKAEKELRSLRKLPFVFEVFTDPARTDYNVTDRH